MWKMTSQETTELQKFICETKQNTYKKYNTRLSGRCIVLREDTVPTCNHLYWSHSDCPWCQECSRIDSHWQDQRTCHCNDMGWTRIRRCSLNSCYLHRCNTPKTFWNNDSKQLWSWQQTTITEHCFSRSNCGIKPLAFREKCRCHVVHVACL